MYLLGFGVLRSLNMPLLAKEHLPIPNTDLLSWSFDNIQHDEDQPIYIDAINPQNSISTRQARSLVRKLIAGLRKIGMKRGDCACINSFNDIHYPLVFLSLVGAGGVFSGVNPGYTPHELSHTLKIAKVKFVFVLPSLLDQTLKATDQVGIPRERVIIFNPNGDEAPKGFLQWKDLLAHGEEDWIRFDDLETAKFTPAARLFSSGTTGLPKAADLSHRNLVAQHTLVFEANPRPWERRMLLALPMFHAATAPSAFCSFIRAGARAYVLPRFEPERWFWAHEEYQITDLLVVPPIAILAINSPLNKKYSLRSVKVATCGAAPLDKAPQARLQKLIGETVPFTQVWGMTETSCIATRFPWPEKDTTGSVGRPMPGLDLKLVSEDGKDVSGPDVRGELCIRGPTVINGYFENPEAKARDWDDEGYFHTGDIAFMDGKTGLFYIVDRKKELIKVRAFQVAPPELEGTLLDHPDIVDAAVIGVPDPNNSEGSELPRAYLVRRDGSNSKPSEQDVNGWMKERLASYKQLVGGIVFVSEIPKVSLLSFVESLRCVLTMQ